MTRRTITVTSAMTGRQRTIRVQSLHGFKALSRINPDTGMFRCVPFLPGHGLAVAMAQREHDQRQRDEALGRTGMQEVAQRLAAASSTPVDTRRLADLLTKAGVTVGRAPIDTGELR